MNRALNLGCSATADASDIEGMANNVIALVDEFENLLREGRVPADFANRLARLRDTAEGMLGTDDRFASIQG
jgi:hypothetical protein